MDEPMLSENELAQMSLRCEQTTPGPWTSYWEGRDMMSGSSFIMTEGQDIYLTVQRWPIKISLLTLDRIFPGLFRKFSALGN